MKTYQIDILNPKAAKLLEDLAALKLITIKETKKEDFMQVVQQLRKKNSQNPPSLEEITREVESVRAERHAFKAK